jgi:energy-converting hydrogenase Eha subunit F
MDTLISNTVSSPNYKSRDYDFGKIAAYKESIEIICETSKYFGRVEAKLANQLVDEIKLKIRKLEHGF